MIAAIALKLYAKNEPIKNVYTNLTIGVVKTNIFSLMNWAAILISAIPVSIFFLRQQISKE